MRRKSSLRSFETVVVILALVAVSVGIHWVQKAKAQDFVRQVIRSTAGNRLWAVTTDGNHVFAIDLAPIHPKWWQPIVPPSRPFRFLQIDPVTEQVIREGKTNHVFARAIIAEQEQTPYSWLAKDYEYWVIDKQNNVVFAARYGVDALTHDLTFSSVDVIDLSTREVKRTIRLQPEADYGAMALHPNGTKLYLSVRERDRGGVVWIYDPKTLERIKILSLDSDHTIEGVHFSKDGQYLFGGVGSRGVAIIDTVNDKIVGWVNPPEDRLFMPLIDLSSDEREIYVGLQYGLKRGAMAAIDVEKRKIVRVLELSPTGCTGVVRVGEKLFAACLDGVYVIDIPAWRKQQ
jgi:DNA-binding beta-propeller fold protein YncE